MKKKLSKSKNNSKKSVAYANTPFLDEYRDLYTYKKKPVSLPFIERIVIDMFNWAKNNKNALVMHDFFIERGIPLSTVQKWTAKFEIFREALKDTKLVLGSRREKGALKREYDANMVRTVMHRYDPEWREAEVWRAELKQKQDEKTQQHNIEWVMEKFPSSKLVPIKHKIPRPRKKKNE